MPNRRPSGVKARAIELKSKGLSVREVEAQLAREGLTASKSSVASWMGQPSTGKAPPRAHPGGRLKSEALSSPPAVNGPGEAPRPGGERPRARDAPQGGALPADSSAPPTAPEGEWALPGVDLVHLPAELLERLAKRYAARIAQEIDAPVIDPQTMGALVRDHERIVKALVMARPPVAADPATDPANLEQGSIAMGHIRRMIADVRKRRADTAPLVGS